MSDQGLETWNQISLDNMLLHGVAPGLDDRCSGWHHITSPESHNVTEHLGIPLETSSHEPMSIKQS